jgi:hypothetical protein
MNDIDRYLDQACRQVNGPDSLRAHLRKELKEHLEEAIDTLAAEGTSRYAVHAPLPLRLTSQSVSLPEIP